LSVPKESPSGPDARGPERAVCASPRTGFFGIDFWHAVEFSRIGRAPRSGLSARSRGNRSNLPRRFAGVKLVSRSPTPARDAAPRPRSRRVSRVLWPPRERPPSGVRHSLPGDVENSRQSVHASANRLVSSLRGRRGVGPGCSRRARTGSRSARGRLGSERLGTGGAPAPGPFPAHRMSEGGGCHARGDIRCRGIGRPVLSRSDLSKAERHASATPTVQTWSGARSHGRTPTTPLSSCGRGPRRGCACRAGAPPTPPPAGRRCRGWRPPTPPGRC
jgi:hypothetical protein